MVYAAAEFSEAIGTTQIRSTSAGGDNPLRPAVAPQVPRSRHPGRHLPPRPSRAMERAMADERYPDSTVLLLAHGSTVNQNSARPAEALATALDRTGRFAAVRPCFWKQEPELLPVLEATRTPRVFVVPLMTGPGYFVDEVFPEALGLKVPGKSTFARVQCRGGQTLYYTHPVGTHPRLTELLLARARAVVTQHPFPCAPPPGETTLVVVGHGTERTPASRVAVDTHVARLRAQGAYAAVAPAFMEDTPGVAEAVRAAGTRYVVVVPLFISDGLHAAEDIPVLLGEPPERVQARVAAGQSPWRNPTERGGKLIWYASSLGEAPQLGEVVLERVREAAGWPVPD